MKIFGKRPFEEKEEEEEEIKEIEEKNPEVEAKTEE